MWVAPPDPENGSSDCPLFGKLCRTEVNEKTIRTRADKRQDPGLDDGIVLRPRSRHFITLI